MLRLTEENMEKVLKKNEGFTKTTYFKGKHGDKNINNYKITDGKLYCQSTGKTAWSDSHFDETYTCDKDQTRRFLRNYIDELDTIIE